MSKEVKLTIDGKEVTVPAGSLVVDAAKKVGIDIPIFCYHPKMEPAGMCRQCLVEIGRPAFDRATGEPVMEEGKQKINWGWKLETSCTNPVSEGMVVLTQSEKAKKGQNDILEFQLTSHPLDCPVCDKGGECLLQDMTLAHGSSESRYRFDEKRHAQKHVALGESIWLDRERCIACGRCVRFQSDLVGEAVLDFDMRGAKSEIVTTSEPGFDSVFSGNTTDICPVGALTTANFRFGARPWEMEATASICGECPVGCNTMLDTRRDAKSGGKVIVKRVMPRQNEAVNETWICDKGRFADFSNADRVLEPAIDGKAVEWTEAIGAAAEKLGAAKGDAVFLADGSLSNEDLYTMKVLADAAGAKAMLYSQVGGGALTTKSGSYGGSGAGDVILVIGGDLYKEAPIFWLRAKQAVDRGATLIVATEAETRLDAFATTVVRDLAQGLEAAKKAFAKAENTAVLYSGDDALAQSCADLNPKSLIGVWADANTQGAWEMGYEAIADLSALKGKTVYVAGGDLLVAGAVEAADFVVAQTASMTEASQKAGMTLPSQTVSERDGTFTSGERRVQRFFAAVQPMGEALPGFIITAQIAEKMGVTLEGVSAEVVFADLAEKVAGFAGLSYESLAVVDAEERLSIGGTCYENEQGLGAQLSAVSTN
ncbi:MAG: molybdopterin-dependent oxidoreductase [Anaerolineae bacterium]|jgi:NADH-quinone oxidoreductase subunit G|nr:molybdopterin-dependent oxidoreductase [Anaerolineae bacterium]MBT7072331.1 molybdopterin-dependent oxidoreductase [Anaerolineae bacterium]MBT7326051.1 molybdopterin-dependent oxidoreductase [Anaerolineae bacterium]